MNSGSFDKFTMQDVVIERFRRFATEKLKIENCDELLNFQQIGNGLYGLIGIKCDKSIPRICRYLFSKIDQIQLRLNRLEFLRYDEILCLFQSLALSQEMLEKYLNKTDYQN